MFIVVLDQERRRRLYTYTFIGEAKQSTAKRNLIHDE